MVQRKVFIRVMLYMTLSFILMCTAFSGNSFAENNPWDCPECGKTGNTVEYCSNCGNPAPTDEAGEVNGASWMKAPAWPDTMFAFNMSVNEMDQRAKELLQGAACWDEVSSPQTLDEFPLYPENFSDMYNDVSHLENLLSISSNTECTWKTGLRALFDQIAPEDFWLACSCRDDKTQTAGSIPSSQINGSYELSFDKDDDFCKYTPENLYKIGLGTCWEGLSSFRETLTVEYLVENGAFTGGTTVCVELSDSEYIILWIRGCDEDFAGEDTVHIVMCNLVSSRTYDAVYDPGTGQKIQFNAY